MEEEESGCGSSSEKRICCCAIKILIYSNNSFGSIAGSWDLVWGVMTVKDEFIEEAVWRRGIGLVPNCPPKKDEEP